MFFGSLGHGTELTQVFGSCLQQTLGIYTAQKYWTVVRLFVPCHDLQCCKLQLALPRLAAQKESLEQGTLKSCSSELGREQLSQGFVHSPAIPVPCDLSFPWFSKIFPSNNGSTNLHSSEVTSGEWFTEHQLQSMKHHPRQPQGQQRLWPLKNTPGNQIFEIL